MKASGKGLSELYDVVNSADILGVPLRTKNLVFLRYLLALCVASASASVLAATYDFESVWGAGTTSLTQTVSSVTLTATRSDGGTFTTSSTGGVTGNFLDSGTVINGTATLTFSAPITITSLTFWEAGNPAMPSGNYVFTPSSGTPASIAENSISAFNQTITPSDWTGITSFTVSYSNGGNYFAGLDQIIFSLANTAPALGGSFTTAGTVNDNATTSPFSAVAVTDADGNNVSVSITYTAANGTLSGTGVTGSAGSYTVTSATPATATSNLQGIVFTPTANQVAPGSTVVTTFTLTPNDGTENGTSNATTQITATSINDAPVITSNGGGATASTSINENTTAVTTITSSDADTGETYTYSISGGVDQALFSINSSTGVLAFASAPNFESPNDSGTNNIYDVQVTVTDSGTGTLTDVQDIAVTVNNVNDSPVITSDGGGASATVNAAENQTAVTTVTATDQDTADTLTYSITGGADQALFNINSSTGVLTFASAPNYESPTDSGTNGVYDVQVTVTDNGTGTLTDVQAIAITVTNVNEAPVITSNGGGATASTSINENTTAVTTVTASDADTADTLTFSISGGADQALFNINSSTGVLAFASAPDFETPTDVGANNVYDVQVTVTDNGTGTLTDVQDIAVTVNNVNENPVITSDGGGASASVNAAENQTAVTTVTATDPDTADTLTYSITGGADQALFNINSSTGVLTFASAPNYESPTDSGTNGVYDVQVTVTDNGTGTLTDVQAIAVTVTDVNEAPVITSDGGGATAAVNAVENQTAVTTVVVSDPDSADTHTFTITGGADQAKFAINSSSGVLTFTTAPDFETPTDVGANNVYDVQVTATDNGTGNLTDVQAIAVTVTNANEIPVISGVAGDSLSYTMNTGAQVIEQGGNVTITDVDSTDFNGGTLTVSIPTNGVPAEDKLLVNDQGAGAGQIGFSAGTVNYAGTAIGTAAGGTGGTALVITLNANATPTSVAALINNITYENLNTTALTENTRTVRFVLNDGDGGTSADNDASVITILNTAPTISGTPETGVGDDVEYVFTPTAVDAQSDPITFSITNQPTWANFDTDTGELRGTPTSADIGTTSGIVITATDGTLSNSLAAFNIEVFADLDNDNIPDSTDDDIDGDGMTNAYEDANGLNKLDASDRDTDLDNDGVSNYDEFVAGSDASVDDYPPVLTVPGTININATGLFTAVSLGTATAVDAQDGPVTATVTQIDSNGVTKDLTAAPTHLQPGIHVVTWTATDAAGNSASDTQTVNVTPLVELSKDQVTSEGATATFKVILNGPAVSYPVSVPYTVAGTALADGSSDHSLVNGTFTINSGLSTTISFVIVDDGAGEGTETAIVTLGTPTNAVLGPKSTHVATITEGNVAPMVSLSADQGSGITRVIEQGSANVVVTAAVVDGNPGDTHTYDWSATDNALVDLDLDGLPATFEFDPATIGLYTLRVTATDDGTDTLSDSTQLTINVVAPLPALTNTDSDGDGVNDDAEGRGDDDSDGVPNYRDHLALQSNVLQEKPDTADSFVLEAEPGVKLSLGRTAFLSDNASSAVSGSDITNAGGTTDSRYYEYAGGIFDFVADDLPTSGQSVQIVIPQFAAIPANAVYRKLMPSGWQNFVEDANNSVASAAGAEGFCPPPGDSSYSPGLTQGHWCVQLTIEDGGPNDSDGVADSTVTDPGGVASQLVERVKVRVHGSGGSMGLISLMLLALVTLLYRKGKPLGRLALLSMLVIAGSVQAESIYLGAAVGSAEGDESIKDLNRQLAAEGLDAEASAVDDRRTGWKLYAGYELHRYIAVELGYVDLGDADVRLEGDALDINSFLNSAADIHPATAQGYFGHFVLHIPLAEQTRINLAMGPLHWKADYSLTGAGASKKVNESGNSMSWTLGVSHQLNDKIQLRVEADSYKIDDDRIQMISLGATYRLELPAFTHH